MPQTDNIQRDTLYFDGLCPLCRKEIRLLQRIQRGGLAFVDIHQLAQETNLPPRDALLRVLHLRTSTDEWLTGVAATARAWSHTRWGWLFRPLLWPWLAPVTQKIYRRWAEQRYRRLYSCNKCMGGED